MKFTDTFIVMAFSIALGMCLNFFIPDPLDLAFTYFLLSLGGAGMLVDVIHYYIMRKKKKKRKKYSND